MANEKRLIDVNEELRKMQAVLDKNQELKDTAAYRTFENVIKGLQKAPTVDAVPVVRCKDCKHFNGVRGCCDNVRGLCISNPNEFCSYGERRKGE